MATKRTTQASTGTGSKKSTTGKVAQGTTQAKKEAKPTGGAVPQPAVVEGVGLGTRGKKKAAK
ncbi:hypothetical protein HGRIS_005575 [Hohenbuehelia grisea]|uniref:Histone H3 n=1 Tax=Hohenbuehelia grisea TaxID=104357 RepID=A0ABR3JXF1_9AGAR